MWIVEVTWAVQLIMTRRAQVNLKYSWSYCLKVCLVNFTCMIPARKVTDEATSTRCSSLVRPSNPVMLTGGPSSGTNLVTTDPIIRLKTGNGPTKGRMNLWMNHLRLRSIGTMCESLTHWDVSGCAEEKVNYNREKCREEPIPGWQRGQQTVSQTCNI